MTNRLGNRLTQVRRQRFVGRSAELELFRTVLSQEVPDFAVLHLHGPGGLGKTTLLHEFAHIAADTGRTQLFLDGRHLDASPAGFLAALQSALHLQPETDPLESLVNLSNPILFLDTYELLAPLDGWLRETFLPQLPERALIVIAGRQPPAAAWRADDGWGGLSRIISLRNLRPDDSAAYLLGQGVPEVEIEQVLGVTYGHPLSLALAADLFHQSQTSKTFTLTHDPDIVRMLLERFVADVPNPVFRQALEVCAHAIATDEALLAHCLGAENAHAAFQWLRALSFIEQGPFGLFPHDLARDLLEAELRWRNLPRFRELHFQVRDHIIEQIQRRSGLAQQFAVFALIFLHRNNPFMRPFYEWQSLGHLYIDQAQPSDIPTIEQLILHHQGAESLAVTRYWQSRPSATCFVFRAASGAVAGFCQVVEIGQATAEDMAADPAVAAAVRFLQTTAPLRPDDVVLYFRNWMDSDQYQNSPVIFNMAAMVSIRLFFNSPHLAYSFIAQANSDYYAGMFDYLRMPLAPAAAFVMDGQSFGVFAHDWRIEPVLDWLNIMGERELLDEIVALDELGQATQPLVLSEPEFAEAVRQALREMRRPDLLAHNPLLRSRCLQDRSQAEPTPTLLQALLREGAETLTSSPKSQKLHRVLWHTYFEPAATQETAAEMLDLPFSTYRYQLGKAIEQLTHWLWQQELYGAE